MADKKAIKRGAFLQAAGATAAGAALVSTGAGTALASSSKAPVTIQFWAPTTDVLGKKIITDLTKTFNDTVGKREGIFAKLSIVASTNSYVKYTTAMISPSGCPDVVMTYSYDPIVSWAANKFIQPMDAYAKAVGVKQADYFPAAWDMVHLNGRIWGLMQEFDFQRLGWNKAIHNGPPPKTIAELDALCKQYVKFDGKGNLTQAGMIPWQYNGGLDFLTFSAAWGASYYDNVKGKWTINTPQNRQVLDWFLKHSEMMGGRTKVEGLLSSAKAGFGSDPWFAGKVAFDLIGEYEPAPEGGTIVLFSPKMKYGLAHVPTAPGVPYGTGQTGGGNVFLLPTKCPHPKEAAVLITYLGGLNAVKEWNIREGNFPPVKAVVFSDEFKKKLPYMGPWIETLSKNLMQSALQSPQTPIFNDAMQLAIDAVTYKRKTSAQALADVETKVKAGIQSFKISHPSWPNE